MSQPRLPIRFQPLLPLALLRDGDDQRLPFPLDEPRLTLTFSGTAALYQGVRAFELPSGSGVLCPSYNCGHEIEPLLRLGLRPDFYPVRRDLGVNLNEIERCLRPDSRALLVTHYFGIGQPLHELRRFCNERGLLLIEDCAHALLSDNDEQSLGRSGDIAIFSVRKSVPIPNGGAVLFNNPKLLTPAAQQTPPRLGTALKVLELATKSVLQQSRDWSAPRRALALAALTPLHFGAELVQRLHPQRNVICYDPDDERFDFPAPVLDWRIDAYSERLLRRLDWRDIARRRRDNYQHLCQRLTALPGCQPLRPQIADGTCPLFLPIAVADRTAVVRHLVRQRVFAAPWWEQPHPATPWQDFPDARYLKDHVLVLPVHQDLDPDQLDYVAEQLAGCLQPPSR